jgi:alpha-tubulin suppressor-like RCC1 family protein
MVLWTITLAACGFRHGMAPPDANDPPEDTLPIDAPGCRAVDVQAGGDHTCATTADGALYCWGRGDDGQIGIDPLTSRCVSSTIFCQKTPAKIAVPATLGVGLGVAHTCSSTTTQGFCWGRNSTGQYGNGTTSGATKPAMVSERAGATMLDGGTGHGCSLAAGSIACSGANNEGQVGNLSVVQQPNAVLVKMDAMAVDVGSATSCAIDTARQLYCWGRNQYRTIDPNSTTIRTAPTLVPGITMVDDVAVGADHICAVSAGTAKCWGLNTSGQVGNGQINNMSQPQPITTVAIANVVEVAASRNHSCARTSAGEVYCFGEGYGAAPMMVTSGAAKITAGSSHDCALMTDGTVRCWGDQLYGQLGNDVDSVTRTSTPQLARLCP